MTSSDRRMTMTTKRTSRIRPIAVGSLIAAVVALQACLEGPTPVGPVIGERGAPVSRQVTDEPSFTPFNRAPQLTNREEVGRALETNYPAELREAGIGGRAEIWVRISDLGVVERVVTHQGTG